MQRIDIEDLDPNGGKCPACDRGPKMWFGSTCDYCGWEEDGSESRSPDRPTRANGKWSLNEFREDYKKRILRNPKYVWSKMKYSKEGKIEWN